MKFKDALSKVKKLIKLLFYNILAYRKIPGFLSANEAINLCWLAKQLPPEATVVEIGSWKGKSTFCLAKGLKSGKVYAIDPFDASGDKSSEETYKKNIGGISLLKQFQEKMRELKVENKIVTMIGLSKEFVSNFDKIDLLFIDGDHSIDGCDFDYANFSPFISKKGYIALHDFGEGRDNIGPNWVVKNKIILNPEFKFVGLFDSLWVAQKQ